MTRGAGGRGPGISPLWALPLGVAVGVAGSVVVGVASRSVLLDVLAWWPVWAVVAGLVLIARGRHLGPVKMSGLVPLLVLAGAIFFVTGHVQGWALMPSASGRLIGPEPEFHRANLTATIDGRLEVTGDATFLYEVTPIRWGGEVGIPDALEQTSDGSISITVRPPSTPGLQAFSGWSLRLSPEPLWDLSLGGEIVADLSGLSLARLELTGFGSVVLGSVSRPTGAAIEGLFSIRFPDGSPVRVVGEADVPQDWERLSDGWHSPRPGVGWVVTVEPGSRLVVEAPS